MKPTNPTKRILIAVVLAPLLISVISTQTFSKGKPPSNDVKAAILILQQFEQKKLSDCVSLLDILRPAAVDPQHKKLLKEAGFPLVDTTTEITDPKTLASIYARTRRVLQFHQREGIIEYVVFRNNHPVVMTKAGAYIAIATKTLQLAQTDGALAGIVAHELSHEYVALDFYNARQRQDFAKMRELELLCDAYAVITLVHLGMNPDEYANVLTKIINNSPESQGLNNGANGTPTLEARLTVITQLKTILTITSTARALAPATTITNHSSSVTAH